MKKLIAVLALAFVPLAFGAALPPPLVNDDCTNITCNAAREGYLCLDYDDKRLYSCASNTWVAEDLPTCATDPPTGTCSGNSVCQVQRASSWGIYGCGTDDAWYTISGSGDGQGYALVQDEGSGLTARGTVNFTGTGVTCTDDAGNTRTNCAITSGGGTGDMEKATYDALPEDNVVDTAAALAANPTDCAANAFAISIDAEANLSCAALTDADVPNDITIDLSTTATALTANGANCSAGQYPLGVDESGAVESCTVDDDQPDSDAEVPDAITIAGGSIGTTPIDLVQSATPTPTVEGRIEWDTDDNRIVVGDGASSQTFYSGAHTTDTNTNADTECAGTQVYLDGEGTCDTLDGLEDFETATDDALAVGNGTGFDMKVVPDCDLSTQKLAYDQTTNAWTCGTDQTGAGGSAIVLDLADDAANESTDITEIATSGDTNSIFSEPTADKLLITLSNNWPTADAATALSANGANCSAGQYPLGVDESGAVEGCTADDDTPESGDFGAASDLDASGQTTHLAGVELAPILATPTDESIICYDGPLTQWTECSAASYKADIEEGDVSVLVDADTIDFGLGFDVGSIATEANITLDLSEITVDADQLQGRNVAATLPTDGQALVWNASGTTWEPGTVSGGSSTLAALTDTTITTPASGNLLLYDGTDSWDNKAMSGDVLIDSAGAATIQANSVALGTDTTGGYAASVSEGGPATTATALASNGANCSAGNYPLGVDDSGAVETCTADDDQPDSDLEVPDALTIAGGTIGTSAITLAQGTAPTPTAEGLIEWDTDDDQIVVGDGVGQAVFHAGAHTTDTNANTACTGSTTYLDGEGGCDTLDGLEDFETATDDTVPVGNGTGYDSKAIPDCDNATTSKLLYDTTTNAFSCGTDQTGGGGDDVLLWTFMLLDPGSGIKALNLDSGGDTYLGAALQGAFTVSEIVAGVDVGGSSENCNIDVGWITTGGVWTDVEAAIVADNDGITVTTGFDDATIPGTGQWIGVDINSCTATVSQFYVSVYGTWD